MPRPIQAITSGVCARCAKSYNVGELVTYSTKPGSLERYCYPRCIPLGVPYAAPIPVVHTPTTHAVPSVPNTSSVGSGITIESHVPMPTPTMPIAVSKAIATVPVHKLNKNTKWYDILPHVLLAGMTRVLLIGPPGTGKSKTASDGFTLRGTCHPEGGPEDIIGTFLLVDGQTKWIDGPGTLAMRVGTRLILDEIDRSSAEVQSLLYGFLDDEPGILLSNGEKVNASPGYSVICTTNASPNDLSEALLDRLEVILVADFPHPKAIESATAKIRSVNPAMADKVAASIANYYRNSLDKSTWKWSTKPTLRRQRNFANLVAYGMPEDVAAKVVMGESGSEYVSSLTTVTSTPVTR